MSSLSTARRPATRRWLVLVVAAIIVLPIAWYLGSPLFLNKSVDEAFPMSGNAALPEGMTRQQAEEEMMKASKETANANEAMPAAGATAVSRGSFTEVDRVHKAKGTATIYKVGGSLILRLDPFDSTNGPDLYVYLSPQPMPRSSEQVHQGGSLEVARLKGNIGSQNY